MPRRTLSPRISTTVTVMSLLITMLSFFFLDSTSIGAYPFPSPEAVRVVGFLHKSQWPDTHGKDDFPDAGQGADLANPSAPNESGPSGRQAVSRSAARTDSPRITL